MILGSLVRRKFKGFILLRTMNILNTKPWSIKKKMEFRNKVLCFVYHFNVDKELAEKIIWKIGVELNIEELIKIYQDQFIYGPNISEGEY